MEPPPSIALNHEPEWICKESALVVWNDPDRSEISSLGLPCPTGKPTQITFWVGKHSTKELCVMLQLRISARFSKRRKVLDYYLLLPPPNASTSVMNVGGAPQDVRECLEDAYGKSKCIRLFFQPSEPGRVLMPSAPEDAPCFGGTPLHLLTQFRSLSRASKLDVYIGNSACAQHALINLEPLPQSVLVCTEYVNLPRSYGGNGGVFDDWRQIGDKPANHFSDAQQPLMGQGCQTGIGNSTHAESCRLLSAGIHEVCRPEYGCPAGSQVTCSPPPYSPPRKSIQASVTPKSVRVSKPQFEPSGHLKRSRVSSSPEPRTESAKFRLIAEPCSTVTETSIVYDTRSPLARSVSYSPTVANTPSTVEDPQHLEHITPTRGEQNSSHISPSRCLTSTYRSASHSRTRQSAGTREGSSYLGHVLDLKRGNIAPSFSTNSSSPETPCIKPTKFTKRPGLLSVPNNVEDVVLQSEQKQLPEKIGSSFVSTQRSLDHVSPTRTDHPLNKALRALVAAQLPPLTTEALQRIMDDLLESVDYSHKVAETGLQETLDEFKSELQHEKDTGIEDITEHAEEILAGVKCQMEDLAGGHLASFEDMLQQTSEQLQQTLQAFLGGLIKAMTMSKGGLGGQVAQDTKTHTSVVQYQANNGSDSSAVAATKLFLQEFGDLQATAKVKALERLTSQSTADVFLTVDRELREAWVTSWTG